MSDLFSLLPPELFRPLASPGARVYASILLQLLAEIQRHHGPLSRERVVFLVATNLADQPDGLALTSDADTDELGELEATPAPDADRIATRGSAILRYLERCGWLKTEMQSDFSQQFVLPDYAFRLLGVMAEIATSTPPPLAGLIYSIHGVLQEALRDGNADFGIPEAYRHTEHLVSGLKELHHNIGLHVNRMLQRVAPSEVLEHFFRDYQSEVVDRAYHQLRTTDHVSRYRPDVLAAIDRLGARECVEAAAHRQVERHEAACVDEASARLYEQLACMREKFERLDRLLEDIDARHNQFVHAAVRAVELHLAAHTTTSGQLVSILKALLADTSDEILPQVQGTLDFFRLELPDEGSLASPVRAGQSFQPDANVEAQAGPSQEEVETARGEVLTQLSHAISPGRVRRYASDLLRDRRQMRAADIPIAQPQDLPILMYLRAYGDGSLGYRVEELSNWVQTGAYAFRDFRLHRVESTV